MHLPMKNVITSMMKVSSLMFIMMLSIVGTLSGQISQGVIEYEVTMDVHRNIPPEREEMKAMIPQFRTIHFQLFFNETASLYKPKENPEADVPQGRGGGMRMMRTPRTETYIDKASKEVTVMQDFMGTNYLISETLDILPWKIGDQMMEIAGYMCMMAWYQDTVQKHDITAWFTPQIQPFLGPDRYVTLPGTVLAVDINNGERVWVARNIDIKEVKNGDIRKPSRGESITREEFTKLVEEQMERMILTDMK
jgi:GLPGLI family protein